MAFKDCWGANKLNHKFVRDCNLIKLHFALFKLCFQSHFNFTFPSWLGLDIKLVSNIEQKIMY